MSLGIGMSRAIFLAFFFKSEKCLDYFASEMTPLFAHDHGVVCETVVAVILLYYS